MDSKEHHEATRQHRSESMLGAAMAVAAIVISVGQPGYAPGIGLLWPAAAAAAFPVAAWSGRRALRPWGMGQLVGVTLVISVPVAHAVGLIAGLTRDAMFFFAVFIGRDVLTVPLLAFGLALCTRPLWHGPVVSPVPRDNMQRSVQDVLPAFGAVMLASGFVVLIVAALVAESWHRRLSSTTALVIPFGTIVALGCAATGYAAGTIVAAVWRSRSDRETPITEARRGLATIYGGFLLLCAGAGAVSVWLSN